MLSTCPVIQLAASDARKATAGATSVGLPEAAQRIHAHDLVAIGGQPLGLGVGGFDEAERHEVGRYAVAPKFLGQRFGQGDRATPRGGRDRQAGFAHARGVAGQVDDAATALAHHVRRHRVTAVNDAIEPDVDLRLPLGRCRVEETLALYQPGVVDQDVDAPEVFDDGIDHAVDRVAIGNVGLVGRRLSTALADVRDGGVRFCL